MIKNISKIELKINNRDYQFLCDPDCSTLEVKEAIFQFLKFIGHIEDVAQASQKQKDEQEDDIIIEQPKIEGII